jgi:di/tricarboxylate transporter
LLVEVLQILQTEVFSFYFVVFIVLLCLALLVLTSISAELILFGGISLVIIFGIIPVEEALSGFSNQGLLTIAALYVVAAGLKETGAIQYAVNRIMGNTQGVRSAQARIMAPVMIMSAFFNNTPIVAAFIPALQRWSRKAGISVSKLLIPLSYAAILGGTCTLIGTSTNLIINGLLIEEAGQQSLGFFEPAYIGLPAAVAGFIYLLLFGDKLIPARVSGFQSFEDTREYTIEMIVDEGSLLADLSIEKAGLRSLPGLFLVEIQRGERTIPAVGPYELLKEGDRLIFTGVIDSIVDLQQIAGLSSATDQIFKLDAPRNERKLIEAVVSPSNPVVGRTIKEGQFRERYNAVVLAVSRSGERLKDKVGDIKLKPGDILLIEAHPRFFNRYKNSSEFYLVNPIDESKPVTYEKSGHAVAILISMVILAASGLLSILQASFLAAAGMIFFRCTRYSTALEFINWRVLIAIASALGLGNALLLTGVAETIAASLMNISGNDIIWALASTYLATWLLTELITNVAAAVLIFPIVESTAQSLGASIVPFAIVILIAASSSFVTPIGYQTNLMVYGPGGYRYTDFTRVGLPLNLIIGIITVSLVPLIWELY